MTFGTAASHYFEAGANVLPIVPGAKVPPRGLSWELWKSRRQSREELDHMVTTHGRYDTAILLGGPAGLVDIETDGPEGEAALRTLDLPLPPTETFSALRGQHRLYRSSVPLASAVNFAEKLDVLASDRYVVVPPSRRRRWINGGDLNAVAELPQAWVEEVGELATRENTPPSLDTCSYSLDTCFLDTSYSLEVLRAEGIEALFRDEGVITRVGNFLQIPSVDRSFRCILPGRAERQPSATLCPNRQGVFVYHDWHRRDGQEWLTLPQVRAALAYGRLEPLRGPQHAVWGLRLLVEAGVLAPLPVDAPNPPLDADPVLNEVYRGFVDLLAHKWLHTPSAPSPFSWRFAAAWCGIPMSSVGPAIKILKEAGYLRQVGEVDRLRLFLPGIRGQGSDRLFMPARDSSSRRKL